jgi:Spy/CpxP family protein refolding chaperone
MENQICRPQSWTLMACILCIVLLVSLSAFGQEQPPQQNQPAPGGPMSQGMHGPGMRGLGGPGMMHGGAGMMPMGLGMRQRDSMSDLMRPEILKELAITAAQRQKLADIHFIAEKESIQHRSALQILHLELSKLTDAENPDRAAIDKKIQEVAQEEAAQMRASINARLNTRAVLTAEQRTKMEQLMQTRMRPGMPQTEGGMPPGRPPAKAGQAREKAPLPAPPEKPQGE